MCYGPPSTCYGPPKFNFITMAPRGATWPPVGNPWYILSIYLYILWLCIFLYIYILSIYISQRSRTKFLPRKPFVFKLQSMLSFECATFPSMFWWFFTIIFLERETVRGSSLTRIRNELYMVRNLPFQTKIEQLQFYYLRGSCRA